jgi:hypothetical protein
LLRWHGLQSRTIAALNLDATAKVVHPSARHVR